MREVRAKMGFDVKPKDLDDFGADLSHISGDTGAAKSYLHTNVSIAKKDTGVGIWTAATSTLEDAVDAIETNLNKLHSLTKASGNEIDNSATMYRHTDRNSAERLDNSY